MGALAFLILAHTDPNHLLRLIKSLPDGYIFVHVDRKASLQEFVEKDYGREVCFLRHRISVSWAGISMIDASNLLIAEALKYKDVAKVVFLSGSCYPIKPKRAITEFFLNDINKNHLCYIDMRESKDHYMKQIKQKWFQEELITLDFPYKGMVNRYLRAFLNKIKFANDWDNGIVPYFGSQWISLSRSCCEFIQNYQVEHEWYRKMNIHSFAPDEHYYHTIVGNSKFAVHSDGLRDFQGVGSFRCANFHLIDPTLTKWFTANDIERVKQSDKLFVRKVSSNSGTELLDIIDELIV